MEMESGKKILHFRSLSANGPLITSRKQQRVKSSSSVASSTSRQSIIYQISENESPSSSISSWKREPQMLSDEEMLQLLKENLKMSELGKAFGVYVPFNEPRKCILNIHFRLLLEHLCFALSNNNFQFLLQHLQPVLPHAIDFQEVLAKLSREQSIYREINHQQFGRASTVEEVEIELLKQMVDNVSLVCRMLLMLDRRQTGFVHISDMQKVIQHICRMKISDQLYSKLWLRYDSRHTKIVEYRDFLKRLAINVYNYNKTCLHFNMKTALMWPDGEIREQDDGHRQRLTVLKGGDDIRLKGLSTLQIIYQLKLKVTEVEGLLVKALHVMDADDNGWLPPDAFRILLSYFTFALSSETFNRILTSLDLESPDKIEWRNILKQIKGHTPHTVTSAPVGTRRQRMGHQPPKLKPTIRLSPEMPLLEQIKRALEECDMSPGPNLLFYFNYYVRNEPCMTRQELRLMLAKLAIRSNEQQFKHLTIILDPDHTNLITYQNFTQLFSTEPAQSQPTSAQSLRQPPRNIKRPTTASVDCRSITWPKLLVKLKERVHANYDNIEKILRACDYKQEGWIQPNQLKKLLHAFCLRLNEREFANVLLVLQDVNGMVNVRKFIHTFYQTEKERLQKWSALVSCLTKPIAPHSWSHSQLDDMWKHLVGTFVSSLVTHIKRLQQDNNYKVPNEEFHRVVCIYTGWLHQNEFDYIWNTYLSSVSDNPDQLFHLQPAEPHNVSEASPTPRDLTDSRNSERSLKSQRTLSALSQTSKENHVEQPIRPNTSAVVGPRGYFSADLNLRHALAQKWKTFKELCLQADVEKRYTIPCQTFLDLLNDVGIPTYYLHRLLQLRYGIPAFQPDADVDYIKFLANLFLTCGKRNSVRATTIPAPIANILLDLRNPVLSQWKHLGKTFRKHDLLGIGNITVAKFLSILRHNDVTLSANDARHLTEHFDPQSTGTIHYKDFLHVFMKSVV